MAVHRENVVIAALHTLAVDGLDMGATFEPLVFSANMEFEEIGKETSLAPIDAELTRRSFSAEVTLAEAKLDILAVVFNLPVASLVSSSSTLVIDSTDRDLVEWLAVGKNGSSPNGGTRTFNFPRSRSVGTPTYNLAKLEATNLPSEFNFYADRDTADVGIITDTESEFFMLYDTARSSQIALDGSATIESVYTAVNTLRLALIRVIYDEATTSDTGVAIKVGKIGDDDYFALFTSEISKSAGAVTELTLLNTYLFSGETMTVSCVGGKTGAGAVTVQIELEGNV